MLNTSITSFPPAQSSVKLHACGRPSKLHNSTELMLNVYAMLLVRIDIAFK